MLYLKGMSATSGIMTFSKHKRKPQEKIMKRAVNGVIQVKKNFCTKETSLHDNLKNLM